MTPQPTSASDPRAPGVVRNAKPEPGASAPNAAEAAATNPAWDSDTSDPRKPVAAAATQPSRVDTREAVTYWHSQDPTLHPAQIATRIGKSERTVRRHLQATAISSHA